MTMKRRETLPEMLRYYDINRDTAPRLVMDERWEMMVRSQMKKRAKKGGE